MVRRIKRTRDFELQLQISNDDFIAPPREAQRNWLINRALNELAADLHALDRTAKRFVAGLDAPPIQDRARAVLDDHDIMEDWQLPVMRAMADVVSEARGDILEIGFGRGVSADYIQAHGVKSHTVVECNDSIVERFRKWKAAYPDSDIRLIHGRWEDVQDRFEKYDGVFFHTYALNEDEFLQHVVSSTTFAEHFFPTAASHLRDGGIFTYLTNEIDSFSREHQRLVLRYFSALTLREVEGLAVPEDTRDTWWADSMVVIEAVK